MTFRVPCHVRGPAGLYSEQMKKILCMITAAVLAAGAVLPQICCGGAPQVNEKANVKPRYLTFASDTYDLGTFPQNAGPQHGAFTFKNNSDTVIVIYDVTSSCNCTTAEWPKAPIKPGESGQIKFTFANEGEKPRSFLKDVTVHMSTSPRPVMLVYKGRITEATE